MAELIDKGALINQLRNENIPFNADINSIIIMQPVVTEAEIRNKAIEEFAEKLKDFIAKQVEDAEYYDDCFCEIYQSEVDEIAEQLKGE